MWKVEDWGYGDLKDLQGFGGLEGLCRGVKECRGSGPGGVGNCGSRICVLGGFWVGVGA